MLVGDGVDASCSTGELGGAVAVLGQEIVEIGILELSFDLFFLGNVVRGRAEIAQILERASCVYRSLL